MIFLQQSLSGQFFVFLYSLALGLVLGIIYDILRIIRMVINLKNIAIFMQDFLYFILSAVLTFIFVLGLNSGNSRFYILAGEGIGWIVYHITLGDIIYKYSGKLVKKIRKKTNFISQKIRNKIAKSKNNYK